MLLSLEAIKVRWGCSELPAFIKLNKLELNRVKEKDAQNNKEGGRLGGDAAHTARVAVAFVLRRGSRQAGRRPIKHL